VLLDIELPAIDGRELAPSRHAGFGAHRRLGAGGRNRDSAFETGVDAFATSPFHRWIVGLVRAGAPSRSSRLVRWTLIH
jgi:hypothetical protein